VRALVVHPGPEFAVADVYRGWCKGLSALGVDVREYNLNDRLTYYSTAHHRDPEGVFRQSHTEAEAVHLAAAGIKAACYDWWPDVVVVVTAYYVHSLLIEVMRSRGHKVACVFTESPYEDDRQLVQASAFDAVVVNDPTNLDLFEEQTTALYLPHAYDPDVHYPGPSEYQSDCVFVGTAFPSRVDYLNRVDWSSIDLALAGNWRNLDGPLVEYVVHDTGSCVSNDQAADLYRGALTSFNLYRTEAQRPELSRGWAMGPREVELAACGTWFARQSRGEGDALFPMLPVLESPEELGDLIRWALAHPDARRDAADRARAAVADRTFDANARALLSALAL